MLSLTDLFATGFGNQYLLDEPSSDIQISSYVSSSNANQSLMQISAQSVCPYGTNLQELSSPTSDTHSPFLPPKSISSHSISSATVADNDHDSANMIQYDCDLSEFEFNVDDIRKQNHSEVEKRRRDKMNLQIKELAEMVPMCRAMPAFRKLDKSTVLRMAVQHIKAIKNTLMRDTAKQMPRFIPDNLIAKLMLQVSDGFLFVVSCDRGKILHVSDSVQQALHYSQLDLLGRSWFDLLHPKDVPKVKEQLSLWDVMPKEKLVDAKTLLPVRAKTSRTRTQIQSTPGSRRSFFCRMKCRNETVSAKESSKPMTEKSTLKSLNAKRRRMKSASINKYIDFHCMGYLKSWSADKFCEESDGGENYGGCLVAIARCLTRDNNEQIKSPESAHFTTKPQEYASRHAMDGIYLFVDQRVTLLLGYLPQEMLGTSYYDYCHRDDVKNLAESHRRALQHNEKLTSNPFRFKTKIGTYIYFQVNWRPFKNPWTQEFEYLMAISQNVPTPDFDLIKNHAKIAKKTASNYSSRVSHNTLFVPSYSPSGTESPSDKSPLSSNPSSNDSSNINRYLNTKIRHTKIGKQIAEEILDAQRRTDDFSSSSSRSSSSDSPSSSYDTSQKCMSSSMSSSSSSLNKPLSNHNRRFSIGSKTSSAFVDSGIDNSFDSTTLLSLKSQSLTVVTPFDPSVYSHNYDYNLNDNRQTERAVTNDMSAMVGANVISNNNNYDINYCAENTKQAFDGTVTAGSECYDENLDSTMAMIMSILEADTGLSASFDLAASNWPVY